MIDVYAHNYLRSLLAKNSLIWPHNLTLSRLIARSLRRRDKSIFQLEVNDSNDYWLGVLIPICLSLDDVALLLTPKQRRHIFQIEIPRLKNEGLEFPVWEGPEPPRDKKVWVLDYPTLISAYQNNTVNSIQLIVPEAEFFNQRLRDVMALQISSSNWDSLIRAYPMNLSELLHRYEYLSRRLFSKVIRSDGIVEIQRNDLYELKDLLLGLSELPSPWCDVLKAMDEGWASWAELDHKTLEWVWHLQPLEPINDLRQLFINHPFVMLVDAIEESFNNTFNELSNIKIRLGGVIHQDPLQIFLPLRQPLPNSECFAEYLLDQSRRLILGMQGLTVLVLDDDFLLRRLTTELSAEFGKRVIYQSSGLEENGILCCSSTWWLTYQDQVPLPEQIILALLPIRSLESPLTAARVAAVKKQGLDWFRDLLLPELLILLPRLVSPLRKNDGRLAILDGRIRSRSWGKKVLDNLQPWVQLDRLLPN